MNGGRGGCRALYSLAFSVEPMGMPPCGCALVASRAVAERMRRGGGRAASSIRFDARGKRAGVYSFVGIYVSGVFLVRMRI